MDTINWNVCLSYYDLTIIFMSDAGTYLSAISIARNIRLSIRKLVRDYLAMKKVLYNIKICSRCYKTFLSLT
jgi:hypothetical protein